MALLLVAMNAGEGQGEPAPDAVPEPPGVSDADWAEHPIDRFVFARLAAAGLSPNPPADRRTLIRRATYDLTGLPPSREEVDAFVDDTSPHAFEHAVDRLLDSPHYGERWGRHWLDLVRYGETNSYEGDGPKPNAWKYRDYVICSFNDDKPYDQFVREQLAGDQLGEVTHETLTATGFYRIGAWDSAAPDKLLARYEELDDIITTVGQAFLGLTIDCARCHDHKSDPISQHDYYSMLAFFADITPYGKGQNIETDVSEPELRERYKELLARMEQVDRRLREVEDRGIARMSAADQFRAKQRSGRNEILTRIKDYLDPEDWQHRQELKREENDLRKAKREFPKRDTILSVARTNPSPPQMHVLLRGNPRAADAPVEPAFPAMFATDESPTPDISAGRRVALADWIASANNPMTARVMANRVWQHHFGRGIVRSSNNLGRSGTPPTHPRLLDWLANQFVNSNWRLKSLHRLMMTSRSYQMSSAGSPQGLAADPENDLFWRFNPRRLSAEEVRDSLLAVSDSLNRQVSGPSFFEQLSPEVLASQSQPGKGWGMSLPHERNRRSVYIHIKRSLLTPMLRAFDFPDPDSSCEARFVTLQPGQALSLLNGQFTHEQAARLARRVSMDHDRLEDQVAAAIGHTLARQAASAEIDAGVTLINDLTDQHGQAQTAALEMYCLSLFNWNEFVFVD